MNLRFIKERSIYQSVFFSIITCGIYGLYWFFSMMMTIYTIDERTEDVGLEVLYFFLTCGIYSYVIYYRLAKSLNRIYKKLNIDSNVNVFMFLVLNTVGLGVVNSCIMQEELNTLANLDANNS